MRSSTLATKLDELSKAIAKADRAGILYRKRLERAEKLEAELRREIEPRLPLGDD